MNTIKRGAFILLEGIDKCGKSTISKRLVELLNDKGYRCELLHFPDRTTSTGHLINEYLKDGNCKLNNETIHLLFAANRWENVDKTKTLLLEGVNVIVDRYSYSGIAYSVAKNMDINWCKKPENGLPKPDIVFLLHLDDDQIAKRLEANNSDNERYENLSMQIKVAATYKQLIDKDWHVIDANDSIENLESLLVNASVDVMERVRNLPLRHFNFD